MRKHLSASWLVTAFTVSGIFYVACDGGTEEPDTCLSSSDCPVGERCINNECVPSAEDAGGHAVDAGGDAMDAGGDAMDAGDAPTDAGGAGVDASDGTDSGPSDSGPSDSGVPTDAPTSGA